MEPQPTGHSQPGWTSAAAASQGFTPSTAAAFHMFPTQPGLQHSLSSASHGHALPPSTGVMSSAGYSGIPAGMSAGLPGFQSVAGFHPHATSGTVAATHGGMGSHAFTGGIAAPGLMPGVHAGQPLPQFQRGQSITLGLQAGGIGPGPGVPGVFHPGHAGGLSSALAPGLHPSPHHPNPMPGHAGVPGYPGMSAMGLGLHDIRAPQPGGLVPGAGLLTPTYPGMSPSPATPVGHVSPVAPPNTPGTLTPSDIILMTAAPLYYCKEGKSIPLEPLNLREELIMFKRFLETANRAVRFHVCRATVENFMHRLALGGSVLHFSGHADVTGLYFDNGGEGKLVELKELKNLFQG